MNEPSSIWSWLSIAFILVVLVLWARSLYRRSKE